MSRWKAAAVHLSISALIGLVSALLIFGVWYPRPYGQATGANELVLLLMGVDIVLGPLLTLAVFRSGKRGLKFDLAVIAVLQACAFTYGMSIVVRARPAFVVAAVDRFNLVLANDLSAEDLAKGHAPQFRSAPWTGPLVVGSEVPKGAGERSKLLMSGMSGKDIERMPEYYVDYMSAVPELLKRAKTLDQLTGKTPNAKEIISAWQQNHAAQADSVVWIPLEAPQGSFTMLIDRTNGRPVDALPINPW